MPAWQVQAASGPLRTTVRTTNAEEAWVGREADSDADAHAHARDVIGRRWLGEAREGGAERYRDRNLYGRRAGVRGVHHLPALLPSTPTSIERIRCSDSDRPPSRALDDIY